jgi:creatinase
MDERQDKKLREDIDTVLKENMVISMEPMIMIPEGQPGFWRI